MASKITAPSRPGSGRYWNDRVIIRGILALNAANIGLNCEQVKKDKSEKTSEILSRLIGKRTSGYGLVCAGYTYFGSWDKAIAAAGLRPVRKVNDFWERGLIIRCLKRLHDSGISLNSKNLTDNLPNAEIILSQEIGRSVRGACFHTQARKKFGSWDKALRAAGFDPKALPDNRRFWTKERIIACILALEREGIPLSWGRIPPEKEEKASEVLHSMTGRRTTRVGLQTLCNVYFDSWRSALTAAGLKPERIVKKRKRWTRDLVIRGISALHREGVRLSALHLEKDKTPRTTQILREALGLETTGCGLWHASRNIIGPWDDALAAAGLNAEKINRSPAYRLGPDIYHQDPKVFWTKDRIVAAIRALAGASEPIPLNATRINRDECDRTSRLIYYAVGITTTGKKLYGAALKRFGKWDDALTAAGLDPFKLNHTSRIWNRDRVIKAIQLLNEARVPLNRASVTNLNSGKALESLKSLNRRVRSGKGLPESAITIFGSWDEALRAAQLDPAKIRLQGYWKKETLSKAIQALHRNNVPLQSSRIQRDKSETTRKIMFEVIGREASGAALHGAARWNFGSWDRALIEAHLDPKKIRETKFKWRRSGIVRAIKCLHKSNIPLNFKDVIRSKPESTRVLRDKMGRNVGTFTIYRNAVDKFGSWDSALFKANLHPCVIRLKANHLERKKEELVQAIMLVHETGIRLNWSSIIKNSAAIKVLTCDKFKNVVSGYSLLGAARAHVGSWDEALRLAKFNPDDIRLRSRTTSNLPIIPHQTEWVKGDDGKWRKQVHFGEPTKTPEQLLIENEEYERLQKAIEALPVEDQNIIQGILAANVDLRENHKDLEISAGTSGLKLSEARIAKILAGLKNSFLFTREMDELHHSLMSYFPIGSEDTILEIVENIDGLKVVTVEGEIGLDEIGQTILALETQFPAFFYAAEEFVGSEAEEAKASIIENLAKIRSALEYREEPSVIGWFVHCLKKHCIDYCQVVRAAIAEYDLR